MALRLDAHRGWWRRSLGLPRAGAQSAPFAERATPAPPDSPLARARLAATAADLAGRLEALERDRAPPERIAAVRSELITLRDRLCRAAREPVHCEPVH